MNQPKTSKPRTPPPPPTRTRQEEPRRPLTFLLAGLVETDSGERLHTTFTTKPDGRHYAYYVPQRTQTLVSRHRSSVGLRWPSKRIAALHRLPIQLGIGRAMRLALRSDGCAQPTTSDP